MKQRTINSRPHSCLILVQAASWIDEVAGWPASTWLSQAKLPWSCSVIFCEWSGGLHNWLLTKF